MRVVIVRHRATSTSCASCARSCRASSWSRCPTEVELPPEDGETFAENALDQGARRARGDRAGRDRRRLGDRGARRSAGGPGSTRPATRGPGASDEENLDEAAARGRGGRRRSPRRLRLRARPGRRGRRRARLRGPLRGRAGRASRAATGGFGYDPAFVPDDTGPDDDAHDGRAEPGGEERDQPPRPRRAAARRAPGAARRPSAMIRTKTRRGGALDRLQRAADRAQARRRGDHRLDRDPHRGGPLADRPGRLGDRLRLGPQGRRAGRRRAPLRPREGREPGGDDRGDADPGRRRDHRLRGDPPAGRRLRGRAPRRRHRRDGLLGARQPRSSPRSSRARRARTTRRRSRATPPTCAPTR